MKAKHENEYDALKEFEKAVGKPDKRFYVLRLYLTGSTPRSLVAVESVKRLCEQYLADRYELEVIDLYQYPERAGDAQIVAAPTLIKELPAPLKRLVGDLTKAERVLVALDIKH